MLRDSQYLDRSNITYPQVRHQYGKNIHILDDPFLFTTLALLCRPECRQPVVNQLLDILYRKLVQVVVNTEFPMVEAEIETRMASQHPEGRFLSKIVDPNTRVVCVNLARAGTVPSQICFDAFNFLLNPDGVRQDHIAINRKTDEKERVIGAHLVGAKIGGSVDSSFLVIPDPMGATGSTICSTLELYKGYGAPRASIAIHLVVTPEYLVKVGKEFPSLKVFTVRLDRGLSEKALLSTIPGSQSGERGLNVKQYIVPGAGGLGEVINNAYV